MSNASAAACLSLPEPPPAVAGFEHVLRYWDVPNGRFTAKLAPGDYYVTSDDEAISTVLGSCISACIRDPVAGVGGMNHFMLPDVAGAARGADATVSLPNRYGSYAMEALVNALLRLGARRERLEIKLFGAGRMLAAGSDIGRRNIEFVHQYLRTEGLQAVAEDLGNNHPRRIAYFPANGTVRVRRLRPLEGNAIAARELLYLTDIRHRDQGGDIELFGT